MLQSKPLPKHPFDILKTFLSDRQPCRIVRFSPLTSRFVVDISWVIIFGRYLSPQIAETLKLLKKLSILQIAEGTSPQSLKKVLELDLERLDVSGCWFDEENWGGLGKMENLKILDADKCRVTDPLFKTIEPLRSLHSLSLKNNLITFQGISTLVAHPPPITNLDLSGNPGILDIGLILIHSHLSLLKLLNISGCGITSKGLYSLSTNKTLEELVIEDKFQHKVNYLEEKAVQKLFKNMRGLKRLGRGGGGTLRYNRNIKVGKVFEN